MEEVALAEVGGRLLLEVGAPEAHVAEGRERGGQVVQNRCFRGGEVGNG